MEEKGSGKRWIDKGRKEGGEVEKEREVEIEGER